MKKIIATAFLFVYIVGMAYLFSIRDNSMNYGKIIILNGPSGAGKTTIQKEFQKLMMPTVWIKLGIDTLFDAPMPDITLENMQYWQSENPIRWVETTHDAEGKKVITLFVGPQGKKVAYGMNSAIAAYAQNGCNVIVDYIAYDQAWLKDLEAKCAKFKTYYVAVDIPLETLEQREAARGTSPVGHARSHYATVYGDRKYDVRVNSETSSAHEIAQQIQKMVS